MNQWLRYSFNVFPFFALSSERFKYAIKMVFCAFRICHKILIVICITFSQYNTSFTTITVIKSNVSIPEFPTRRVLFILWYTCIVRKTLVYLYCAKLQKGLNQKFNHRSGNITSATCQEHNSIMIQSCPGIHHTHPSSISFNCLQHWSMELIYHILLLILLPMWR